MPKIIPTKVLLFEGRARQCLPFIRAFKSNGCQVDVLCASKMDVAYASRFVDNKILGVCNNQDEDGTTKEVRQLLENGQYDLVVPMTDFAATVLSKNKPEFSKYSYVVSNDRNIKEKIINKNLIKDNNILIDNVKIENSINMITKPIIND